MESGGTTDIAHAHMHAQSYFDSIISVKDKKTGILLSKDVIQIQPHRSKYSSTKVPIYKFIIDGRPISRNNNYTVNFNCMNCKINREISMNLFVRKVNNGGKRCQWCANTSEEKRAMQSEFIKTNFTAIMNNEYTTSKIHPKLFSAKELLDYSRKEWENETDEFKEIYFLKHLTCEEFETQRIKIKSVGNGKIVDLAGWTYIPFIRIFNQAKYVPVLFNEATNSLERPYYLSFDCENCSNEVIHRDLEVIKNKIKIWCKDCSLSNETFKIRKLTLRNGTSIFWQSIPERRFIEWCEENNIEIKNGPKLKYTLDSVSHIYKVDFELPSKKIFIEIKDNHCWYKQQIKNGKQAAKDEVLRKHSEEVGYDYYTMFPKNTATIKQFIMQKVLQDIV